MEFVAGMLTVIGLIIISLTVMYQHILTLERRAQDALKGFEFYTEKRHALIHSITQSNDMCLRSVYAELNNLESAHMKSCQSHTFLEKSEADILLSETVRAFCAIALAVDTDLEMHVSKACAELKKVNRQIAKTKEEYNYYAHAFNERLGFAHLTYAADLLELEALPVMR